jgi:hypothetical protein
MARDHGRILVSIWKDRDFKALTVPEQHMYILLATQPDLSYCGVMDWWPNRLAQLAADLDEPAVYAAVGALQAKDYVLLDPDTSEVLVRSYVRYDGVMNRANMGKACVAALGRVNSEELEDRVVAELARLHRDEPGLSGFIGVKEAAPKVYEKVISMALSMGDSVHA